MLISFSVENYLSFKENTTFSLVAYNRLKHHKETNTFKTGDLTLLRSAAIYGANASGKSNFIKALSFVKSFIINSSKDSQVNEPIKITPFLLDKGSAKKASKFEIIFKTGKNIYRYGFTVDSKRVHEEWLYKSLKTKDIVLFIRKGKKIDNCKDKTVKELFKFTRENTLLISLLAQLNNKLAKDIVGWFESKLTIIDHTNNFESLRTTWYYLKDQKKMNLIKKILKFADFNINNITIKEPKNIPLSKYDIAFPFLSSKIQIQHSIYEKGEKTNKTVDFDLIAQESEGTKHFLSILGPFWDVIFNNKVLIIDELNASLHPSLSKFLINLFQVPENKSTGQIVFTTHDISLLNNKLFRTDQVWFTQKSRTQDSELFSLVEYDVRSDASFSKDYMNGRYGAIPIMNDFPDLFKRNI